MVNNPSELMRLEQEEAWLKETICKPGVPKSVKEYLLRDLRRVERALGHTSTNYNSNEFAS